MEGMIIEADRKKIYNFCTAGLVGLKIEEPYWIINPDWIGNDGAMYCKDCAAFEIERLEKKYPNEEFEMEGDNSGETDSDSPEYCEECGDLLETSLTDEGCEEEIDAFIENGFDINSEFDCYVMTLVIDTRGWEAIVRTFLSRYESEEKVLADQAAEKEYFCKFNIICGQILKEIEDK